MTQPSHTPFVARISPKRPAGSPSNLGLPWLEGIDNGRRFFTADLGFVPVGPTAAEMLKRVHCDGELTERGGQGPLLFEVLTPEQAHKIVGIEQRRAMIESAGGNAALKAALNGTWTDDDLDNIGVPRAPAMSAADIAKQAAASAAKPQAEGPPVGASATDASPVAASATEPTKGRVGRRPPRGKAPLPGAGA